VSEARTRFRVAAKAGALEAFFRENPHLREESVANLQDLNLETRFVALRAGSTNGTPRRRPPLSPLRQGTALSFVQAHFLRGCKPPSLGSLIRFIHPEAWRGVQK